MGYTVYRDIEGHDRWAGYAVPAECDMPGCEVTIDRGLGYKCQDGHAEEPDHDLDLDGKLLAQGDPEFEDYGCGLYFCTEHLYDTDSHDGVEPKPDSVEWVRWMLEHESWQQWRDENPEKLTAMRERVAA